MRRLTPDEMLGQVADMIAVAVRERMPAPTPPRPKFEVGYLREAVYDFERSYLLRAIESSATKPEAARRLRLRVLHAEGEAASGTNRPPPPSLV